VQEGDEYVLLTDILGLEDFSGDMDFKVTGTTEGVTAIQLDVKDAGLTVAQIAETIDRAKDARLVVLKTMLDALAEPRKEVSVFAPKINLLHIPVEKIGELIGPGGKNIKNIIATTGAQVDVEDDGTVSISAVSEAELKAATDWVSGITRVVTPGEEFENAEVKRILPFGAFVEFLPGKEGMVHVSQMSTQFVKDPNEIVHIGDKVKVRVMEIDAQGRTNLSMLFGEDAKKPVDRGGGHTGGGSSQGGSSFRPHSSSGPRSPRPYTPRNDAAAPAPVGGAPVRPQHPLARQFQRERTEQQRKDYKKRY